MKILIIHEIDWINKVTFEPHHLAELFSLNGHTVFVVDCPEPNRNIVEGLKTQILTNYGRIYDGATITLIRPPALLIKGLNRISNFLTCGKTIRNAISKYKIDIVLLYGVATNGKQSIVAAKKAKIPLIFRALDIAHGLVKIPLVRQIAMQYEKYVIQNADKILTTTPDLGRYAHEMGGKQENIETLHLGINTSVFKPMEKDQTLCKKLGIDNDDKVIVFMGTLYDFSGLDAIITNFDTIQQIYPTVKLLIVGGGPSLTTLNRLVREKKMDCAVYVTGFVPQNEIPRYLALADLCINPFHVNYVTNRILPTKILEYFACGKPVLSTPLQGTKELLPSEDYGITYATSDEFVSSIARLLKDKNRLQKMGQQGYMYVKNNHDWNMLTKKLLAHFDTLIKSNT
jgi:glycosyltransferase involved in cell wall biosynthesis